MNLYHQQTTTFDHERFRLPNPTYFFASSTTSYGLDVVTAYFGSCAGALAISWRQPKLQQAGGFAFTGPGFVLLLTVTIRQESIIGYRKDLMKPRHSACQIEDQSISTGKRRVDIFESHVGNGKESELAWDSF